MSLIESLFSADRRIERPIESVITYGRADDEALSSEISEYYVTAHIDRAITELLKSIQRAQQGSTGEIGVWVSGVYGSGKSSFSKYLSFAIDGQRKVGGEPFRKLFASRLTNEDTRALLNGVAHNFNPQVILLDLGADQIAGRHDQKISDILYFRVLQWAGYSSDIKLAEFEMRLEVDGKMEEFRKKVKEKKKRDWDTFKNVVMEALPIASQVAHELYPNDYTSGSSLMSMRYSSILTVRDQAKKMIDIARKKSGRENLLFVLDEAGHFVSIKEDLVLDLKGFAEIVKEEGKGKVWLMATAQQTLMEDAQSLNSDSLYKLHDRFPIGVHLEASDIKEITYQRLLSKSPEGTKALRLLWTQHYAQFRLATALEGADAFQGELTEESFAQLYPFLPSQFEILVRLLGRLAKKTGGSGLRSTIKIVQEIMNKGDHPLAQREVGVMATAADLYDALKNDIREGFPFLIQGVEDVAMVFPSKPFHLEVAKAIAVLQVLELVRATPQNLAAVLCPRVGVTGSLKPEVETALRDFELDGRLKIQPGQHGAYLFLSDTATGLHRAFEETEPEPATVTSWLNKTVFKAMQEDLPQATVFTNKSIKVALDVWHAEKYVNQAGGNESVRLQVRFASSAQIVAIKDDVRTTSGRPAEVAHITVVALRQESHLELARKIAKCERFLTRYGMQNSPDVKDYLQVVTHQKERAERELTEQYQQALRAAPVYAHGLALSLDANRPISDALASLLSECGERIFSEFPKASINVRTNCASEFLRCDLAHMTPSLDPLGLVRRIGQQMQLDEQHAALLAIKDYLRTHGVPSGKELLDHFENPPFGWSRDTIRYLAAALLHGGVIELKLNGLSHRTASSEACQALANDRSFREAGVKLRENAPDIETRARVTERLAELLGDSVLPTEPAIAKSVQSHVPRMLPEYGELAGRLQSQHCACHERVRRLAKQLDGIVSGGDGTEIITALGTPVSSLYDEWRWVRKIKTSFSKAVGTHLSEVAQLATVIWPTNEPTLEPFRTTQKIFVDAALAIQQDERAENGFDGLSSASRELKEFLDRARQAVESVTIAKYARWHERLQGQDGWASDLDDEQRRRLLAMVRLINPAEGLVGLPLLQAWLEAYRQADSAYLAASEECQRLVQEKKERDRRRIEEGLKGGKRPSVKFKLRLPRVIDSADKLEEVLKQLRDCERQFGTANIEIELEQFD